MDALIPRSIVLIVVCPLCTLLLNAVQFGIQICVCAYKQNTQRADKPTSSCRPLPQLPPS